MLYYVKRFGYSVNDVSRSFFDWRLWKRAIANKREDAIKTLVFILGMTAMFASWKLSGMTDMRWYLVFAACYGPPIQLLFGFIALVLVETFD